MEDNGTVKEKGSFQRKVVNFLKTELASAIFFIIVGLFLTIFPTATVYVICKVVFGLLLILTGLYNIFMYLSERAETTVFNMLSGVIVLVLGLFLFNNPQIVVRLMHQLLGALILIDSVWLLRLAYKMKKASEDNWKFCMVVGIICVILGIIIVVNPFAKVRTTVIFSGVVFLINGIVDVVIYIVFRKDKKPAAADITGGTSLTVPEKKWQKPTMPWKKDHSAESSDVPKDDHKEEPLQEWKD